VSKSEIGQIYPISVSFSGDLTEGAKKDMMPSFRER
jgi:hypothetical protein